MGLCNYICGLLLAFYILNTKFVTTSANLQLCMVNVVFRHGDRTPEKFSGEMYPNDPFINKTFFPIGYGGLTQKGKLRAFALGNFLRERYGKFLGSTYVPKYVTARSTHFERTKMTLLLVLAGLYPPNSDQKWHPTLNWQPIPIKYKDSHEDLLLLSTGCPRYIKMLSEVRELPEVKKLSAEFQPLWKTLSKLTGSDIKTSRQAFNLYNTLIAEKSMNLPLSNWAKQTLTSKQFHKSVALDVHLQSYNETLKRLNGGRLLRKMTNDMIAKIDGKLENEKKINLYSSHDINVAAQLLALGVTKPHHPYYTSAVILELYRDELKNYYVQVVYYKGFMKKAKILKIPNCSENNYGMCEFNEYLELMKPVMPTNQKLECCDNDLENCTLNLY